MVQSLWLFVLLSQIYFSESQNPVYHFIKESKSWPEAQTFCRKFYTDLATVRNMKDLERLRAAAGGGGAGGGGGSGRGGGLGAVSGGGKDPWIGLYQTSDRTTDRKWHWSQPEVQYKEGEAVWRSGEPNDFFGKPENCVEITTSNKWNDAQCDVSSHFICYNESSNTTVMIKNPKTWLGAQQFCRTHHTDLMSGLDQQRLFEAKYPQRCTSCWIGLSRDNWGWSDGSDSSFRNWNTDVNPLTKKCATLTAQGRWESEDCGLNRTFICHDDLFILVKENKTWEEALVHCRRQHRDLAWFIHHTHLKRMVRARAEMADGDAVWVGLHYACFFQAWIWVNGHYVSGTDGNWKDPGVNDCGVAGAVEKGGDYKWVKRGVGETHYFICASNAKKKCSAV